MWAFIIIIITMHDQEIIWAYVLVGIFGFGYLLNCCFSDTAKYLFNEMKPHDVGSFLNEIMKANTSIVFNIECYHMETRHRTVTERDSNGNTHTRTETYQEKVVTYRGSQPFVYKSCTDVTGQLAMEVKRITRLHILKEYKFANAESERRFNDQKNNFYNNNRRDVHNDLSISFSIDGFRERLLVLPVGLTPPCCFSDFWYIIWSVLGLSWFYRMWFDRVTEGKRITIMKSFEA